MFFDVLFVCLVWQILIFNITWVEFVSLVEDELDTSDTKVYEGIRETDIPFSWASLFVPTEK